MEYHDLVFTSSGLFLKLDRNDFVFITEPYLFL